MSRFDKVCILVMDSAGVGELPDAGHFGDAGASTIANATAAAGGANIPNLAALGLARLTRITGTDVPTQVRGAYGKMSEASAGKDTITGHWEMAGVITDAAFATFPDGFGPEILDPFIAETGRGVLGNCTASGTEIIGELGAEQIRTGQWIVYTSADSVFQIAAHEEAIGLEALYEASRIARRIGDEHDIARVIARPFVGGAPDFTRTYNRRDFSVEAAAPTLCDALSEKGVDVIGVGKISDIFAGRGVGRDIHTEGNADGLKRTIQIAGEMDRGLLFTNLVDFDMLYGHRRNPAGYARALEETDAALPALVDALGPDGLLIISADHGCDPTFEAHTDHTREFVPVLCGGVRIEGEIDLGERATFADLGQTVAENFGARVGAGSSFLGQLV